MVTLEPSTDHAHDVGLGPKHYKRGYYMAQNVEISQVSANHATVELRCLAVIKCSALCVCVYPKTTWCAAAAAAAHCAAEGN